MWFINVQLHAKVQAYVHTISKTAVFHLASLRLIHPLQDVALYQSLPLLSVSITAVLSLEYNNPTPSTF